MILFFDTETTGLPRNYKSPMTDLENWPRVIQLAWQLYSGDGKLKEYSSNLILPDGWKIPKKEFWLKHGYTQERSLKEGVPIKPILKLFLKQLEKASILVAHNMNYDYNVLGAEFIRAKIKAKKRIDKFCTMQHSTSICKIEGKLGYKWPNLTELHRHLFNKDFEGAHDALYDVKATAKCYFEMKRQGLLKLR